MKKYPQAKTIFHILIFIFGINFIWEISQMFLYAKHTTSILNFIFVHIKATLGDVLILSFIYLFGTAIFRSKIWFSNKGYLKYFFAAICGFAIAITIEKYALATSRWQYDNLMLIIPFFKVGLSPILQMIFLPITTIFFLQKMYIKKTT